MNNGENIFDKLWEEREMPPESKKEVMSSLEALKMVLEIADLFTIKQIQADVEILSAMGNSASQEPGEEN